MDPLAELERMAANATATSPDPPTEASISRWRQLFQYTRAEATALITAHRADVTRAQIPDSHWALVREEREAAGYDREAYEHALQLKDVLDAQSTVVHDAEGKAWSLVRLGGLLGSAEKVRDVAGLGEVPVVEEGWNEMGVVRFVMVDEEAKRKIDSWVEMQQVL